MKTSSLEKQGKDIVWTSFQGEKFRIDPAKIDLMLNSRTDLDDIIAEIAKKLDDQIHDFLVLSGLGPERKF